MCTQSDRQEHKERYSVALSAVTNVYKICIQPRIFIQFVYNDECLHNLTGNSTKSNTPEKEEQEVHACVQTSLQMLLAAADRQPPLALLQQAHEQDERYTWASREVNDDRLRCLILPDHPCQRMSLSVHQGQQQQIDFPREYLREFGLRQIIVHVAESLHRPDCERAGSVSERSKRMTYQPTTTKHPRIKNRQTMTNQPATTNQPAIRNQTAMTNLPVRGL